MNALADLIPDWSQLWLPPERLPLSQWAAPPRAWEFPRLFSGAYARRSSRNSDGLSPLVTSKWSRARVQATYSKWRSVS